MKLVIAAQLWARDRLARMRDIEDRARGASALEWVLIAAATVAIIALVYAAINSKVAEKIGVINDA